MTIILCGMPASGKSYFGKHAAEQLQLPFIDTDDLILAEYAKLNGTCTTCREIVLKEGEPFFRTLETKVIKELDNSDASIIAVGGGALCSPENIAILKNMGWLIYLRVSPEVLRKRILNKEHTPAILDVANIEKSFDELLKQRLSIYEQNCHFSIDVHSEDVLKTIHHYMCRKRDHGK